MCLTLLASMPPPLHFSMEMLFLSPLPTCPGHPPASCPPFYSFPFIFQWKTIPLTYLPRLVHPVHLSSRSQCSIISLFLPFFLAPGKQESKSPYTSFTWPFLPCLYLFGLLLGMKSHASPNDAEGKTSFTSSTFVSL